jgi:hypothetical protein
VPILWKNKETEVKKGPIREIILKPPPSFLWAKRQLPPSGAGNVGLGDSGASKRRQSYGMSHGIEDGKAQGEEMGGKLVALLGPKFA